MTILQRFILLAAIGLVVLGWPTAAAGSVKMEMELQNAARRFRVTTYQYFRNDRKTYERRALGSHALIERWRSHGAVTQDARDLVEWFENAIVATQRGQGLADLPFQVAPPAADASRVHLEAMPELPQSRTGNAPSARRKPRVLRPAPPPAPSLVGAKPSSPLPPTPPRHKALRPPITPPGMSARIEVAEAALDQSTEAIETSQPEKSNLASLAPHEVITPATAAAEQETMAVTRELPARVNTSQLRQRLARHNQSMRALQQKLRLNDNWSVESLERVLRALEDLAARYDVWNLYANTLNANVRRQMGRAETFDTCLELIKQRVFELQIANETEPSSQAALERSRRLHAIDERVRRWPIQ